MEFPIETKVIALPTPRTLAIEPVSSQGTATGKV